MAPALAAPDEILLGKTVGYPVCPLTVSEQVCLVGQYSHLDELVPSRRVAKGARPWWFRRAEQEPKLSYHYRQRRNSLEDFLDQNRNTGLLVIQDDTILVERYQYDREPEHRLASASIANTVIAMLVGIALEEGLLSSLDYTAGLYVPELRNHPYGETPIRELLTMSSGVKFAEEYSGRDHMAVLNRKTFLQQGPGGVDTVLPFAERGRPAGEKFVFASADAQVLGLVLRAAVGRPLAEYLSEKIWQPMGAEADASWLHDAGGYEIAYCCLNATLRDYGRFGLLLANGGAHEGRQIIPADWVKAATTPAAPHLAVGSATRFNGFGYQTWILDDAGRFALFGVRGQAIFVDPKTKLVIVHTAVHPSPLDSAPRGEQYALFYGALKTLHDLAMN
jgi:CubicO group peptidase (beta-lactamase class C family)